MITERHEEGLRINSVETEEELLEALDQITDYRLDHPGSIRFCDF